MNPELIVRFNGLNKVWVKFDEYEAEVDFTSPLTEKDSTELRWYLETYATVYTADIDDRRADRTKDHLKIWGEKLFKAIFHDESIEPFLNFRNTKELGRVLTIQSSDPAMLSLPWELLHSAQGGYLFNENPRISVRRNLANKGGRAARAVTAKERLRLLFIVSRPEGAELLNPRAEPQAILQALADEGIDRVDVEFLRPATLENLLDRLDDDRLPTIDILHFDGHGVFDRDGSLQEREKQALLPRLTGLKQDNSSTAGKNTGYLLFEDKNGKSALIPADVLGELLHQQNISLVVLSACQSAMVAGEEPFGSVAARLTQTGIPAIIAMPYSVLITTTRWLFAEFYLQLARGRRIGESLENARRKLMTDSRRGERQRGTKRVTLHLDDWFVPNLYQSGRDNPLLSESVGDGGTEGLGDEGNISNLSNLPPVQEVGFFGRNWELWQIERAFVGQTRRLTIHGFSGQGKTALAQEAGRWFQQTGMFERVCFVDYDRFQGLDAVSLAVANLSTVLEQSFIDTAAVTISLKATPTLVILDNLESLAIEPLRELLDAAKNWSEAGKSRVLLTSRSPDFHHPDYATSGTHRHITRALTGLGDKRYPDDALDYLQALMALPPAPILPPPTRDGSIELCKLVNFHPLSLALLAQQLKTRRTADVGQTLKRLLKENEHLPDKERSLMASLQLSLERLNPKLRACLPRLSVFQGGALEAFLLAITDLDKSTWQELRQQLEATGLIQVEWLPNEDAPFLKFHPTLAPALWAELTADIQQELLSRHHQIYAVLSGYLYQEDFKNPHTARSIARRELPNLMSAVREAIDRQAEGTIEFVKNINYFLNYFGLNRDRAALTQQAAFLDTDVGSQDWYLARTDEAEQLLNTGRVATAAEKFQEILEGLGDLPNFNRCTTLARLGRCFKALKQLSAADRCYRTALEEIEHLERSDDTIRAEGVLQCDLADVLTDMGDYSGARTAYEISLARYKEVEDLRNAAVCKGQFGTLALLQGDLVSATQSYGNAIETFQTLGESAMEAVYWHQLGMAHQRSQQWAAAEQAFRRSAEQKESLGDRWGAANSWISLAIVYQLSGNSQESEEWYRKALATLRSEGDLASASFALNNLGNLLSQQPARLAEARQLAEEALEIKLTLDPAAATIWTTYEVLGIIADLQQAPEQAIAYRCQARQAKAAFAGTRYELERFVPLMDVVIAATTDTTARQELEPVLEELHWGGLHNLVAAIWQILVGERDEDTLCAALDLENAMVVMEILERLEDG